MKKSQRSKLELCETYPIPLVVKKKEELIKKNDLNFGIWIVNLEKNWVIMRIVLELLDIFQLLEFKIGMNGVIVKNNVKQIGLMNG